MSAPRFVVSTTFRGRTRTETWDPESPMMLGRTERGPLWVMEHTASGQVRVRSLSSQLGEVGNAHSQLLAPEQISRGVQVKFKKKDSDEIKLEVRAIKELHPKFYRDSSGVDFSNGFLVYHCVGDWNADSTRYKREYVGRLGKDDVFKVTANGQHATIHPKMSGITVEVNGKIQSLDSMKELTLSASEFFRASVRFGHASWYFASATESRRDKIFEIPLNPGENREFFKYAIGATLSLLVFIGGSALLPKPEKEEVIPPQILKVLVHKPKKKGQKQEIPAEKRETKEKAIAQSEEITKTPKPPNEVIIPKGQAAQAKAPTPPRKQVQRVNRVANLYQGVMRGGLAKILDSKQLLDSAKLGAGGTRVGGDSKALSTALSNIAVDVNAGAGVGNSKVVGFGGDSNAGVRGPAQIGYSNGVKGALSSGTGGDRISLGTSDAEVEEGLTKEEVGRVIHAHMKEVRYCYESSMVRASRVDGKVVLDFMINGKGVVATAKVSSSTLPDAGLGECIMRRLRTWQFPTPKGGVKVDVSYPFTFKTLGG